jgi:hypothetical protein
MTGAGTARAPAPACFALPSASAQPDLTARPDDLHRAQQPHLEGQVPPS